MKAINEFKETTNRTVYNRAKKSIELCKCPICGYHKGCNSYSNKHYYTDGGKPNWKLVSKNKKQYMPKKYKLKELHHWYNNEIYYEIII